MEGGASAVQRNKQTRQDSYQKAMGSLDSANNLVAASLGRPRRQDSYQQAMGSLDPSTYPGSKPRRQDSYQQAMSSFDSQVCSFDKVKSINDVRFWGK